MIEWLWSEQANIRVFGDEKQPVTCHLRWTHPSPGSYQGIWQVTTLSPPISLVNWQDPPGIIASGRVDLMPNGTEFDVSFVPRIPIVSGLDGGDEFFPAPPNMTFYLRLIGLDSRGSPDEMPSNGVAIAYERVQIASDGPPHGRVLLDKVRFQPFKPKHPKAHEWFLVTQDKYFGPILFVKKGQALHIVPEKDDQEWYDHVIDAIGDIGEFIKDAVNWVSDAWNDLKAWTVNTIASGIPGCGAPCKAALETGLNAGLAAMGVPPSIPNFDELTKMGKDYLVERLAAEAGVPPELVEKGVDKLLEKAEATASTGPSGDQFLRPHPDYLYRPPFVHVTVINPDEHPSLERVMTINHDLFFVKTVKIPPLAPGQTLTIPVNLDPKDIWGRSQAVVKKTGMIASYSACAQEWWHAYTEQMTSLRILSSDLSYMHTFIAAQGYTSP